MQCNTIHQQLEGNISLPASEGEGEGEERRALYHGRSGGHVCLHSLFQPLPTNATSRLYSLINYTSLLKLEEVT